MLNSTNSAELITTTPSADDWTSANPYSANSYPMQAVFDLGGVYDVSQVQLYLGDGTSTPQASVYYLPTGMDPQNTGTVAGVASNYLPIATNLALSGYDTLNSVITSGTYRTQFILLTVGAQANYPKIDQIIIKGTSVPSCPLTADPIPIAGTTSTGTGSTSGGNESAAQSLLPVINAPITVGGPIAGVTPAGAMLTVTANPDGFNYGVNTGWYSGLSDSNIYQLSAMLGATGVRNGLWDTFMQAYGTNVRTSAFSFLTGTLGVKDTVTMLALDPGLMTGGTTMSYPTNAAGASTLPSRDPNFYSAGTGLTTTVQSSLWAGMYQPIWTNGTDKCSGPTCTVNTANKLAVYMNTMVQNYGNSIKYYEFINEPDAGNGTWYPATQAPGTAGSWWSSMPVPGDTYNLNAPITSYIRGLHVVYAVVKNFHPEAYVTPGGVSYPSFLDCLLRYSENPGAGAPEAGGIGNPGDVNATFPTTGGAWFDAMSWHWYPEFSDNQWNNTLSQFNQFRYSDYLMQSVRSEHNNIQAVLQSRGYGGPNAIYPAKLEMNTEGNVSRYQIQTNTVCATSPGYECTGGIQIQENYTVKAMVEAQRDGMVGWYWYGIADSQNGPELGTPISPTNIANYDNLMGMFLNPSTTITASTTQEGVMATLTGETTTTQGNTEMLMISLLKGYTYSATQSAALALPAGVDGGAFVNSSGKYVYVLWAVTTTDESEVASASYSFPIAVAGIPATLTTALVDGTKTGTVTTGVNSLNPIALTGAPLFLH
jgi:hypothetical protein